MSKNYDNWERLVAAVIKREEIWQLCHQPSRTPSICSEASSSDFSSSFRSDFELEKKPLLLKLVSNKRGEAKATEEEFKIVYGDCGQENIVAALFSEYGKFNDFHPPRSLHDLLHGKGSAQRNIVHINQENRLKVAVGAARGIAHLHSQYLAHGYITSSNIFLNPCGYGLVSEYEFAGILRMPEGVDELHYHASEYEFKNASRESDVYSFGVVLLELLTRRSPLEDTHIVEWAHSITFNDWCSNSDLYLLESPELIFCDEVDRSSYQKKLKQVTFEIFGVAMRCVHLLPVGRPQMIEVVLMLEKKYKRIFLETNQSNCRPMYWGNLDTLNRNRLV